MRVIYDNKIVEVIKLVTATSPYIKYPVLVQVKVQWRENGELVDDYVDVNNVELLQ